MNKTKMAGDNGSAPDSSIPIESARSAAEPFITLSVRATSKGQRASVDEPVPSDEVNTPSGPSSQTSGEPGPATPDDESDLQETFQECEPSPKIPIDKSDIDTDPEELEYFRSLPEEGLRALYPRGIRPPANLGPSTPFDKYTQFHEALLHLAAGVDMADIMRVGKFDLDGREFVQHMAGFCVKSLDYTFDDIIRLRAHLDEAERRRAEREERLRLVKTKSANEPKLQRKEEASSPRSHTVRLAKARKDTVDAKNDVPKESAPKAEVPSAVHCLALAVVDFTFGRDLRVLQDIESGARKSCVFGLVMACLGLATNWVFFKWAFAYLSVIQTALCVMLTLYLRKVLARFA